MGSVGSDKKDFNELNESVTKKCSENKSNSSKVYSNNRRFDSFVDKSNEKTNRSQRETNLTEVNHNSRGHRNNDFERRNHYRDHYYHNSNRFPNNPSSDRNQRSEPIPTKSSISHTSSHSTNGQKLSTNEEVIEETNCLVKTSDNTNKFRSNRSDHNFGHNSRRRPQKRDNIEEHIDLQQKLDELTALQSIFDETVLTIDRNELKGRFLAEPLLNDNKIIVSYRLEDFNQNNRRLSERFDRRDRNRSEDNCYSNDKKEIQEFCVQHLPPIELYFELSRKYPSKINPLFLISCKWLTREQLDMICQKLEDLYYETQMEVLFTWFSFLTNEVLSFLNIENQLDISPVVNQQPKWVLRANKSSPQLKNRVLMEGYGVFQPQIFRGVGRHDRRAAFDVMGAELIPHLKAYNEYKEKETFNKRYIFCNICFSNHLGEDCFVFPCNHINCKTCIRDYFTTLINEGTVNQIKCPETKCETPAPPHMIQKLISGELYEKYDKLMTDSMVGVVSNACICPRQTCGNLVIAEEHSTLAHCTECRHAFCKICKSTYHGVDPCNMLRDPQKRREILEKYQNSNATEREKMEKQFGKKQLIVAIEEMETQKWLEDMSKRCPHCKAFIEKSDGCNKMSCWRCNTFFCWLCLERLPPTQPYTHFNNPQSKCFNQLFRGVVFNAEDLFEDDFD